MKTVTITKQTQIVSSIISQVRSHSDLSLIVETTTKDTYFAGMLKTDPQTGWTTLYPVEDLSIFLGESDGEDEFSNILP